MAGNYNSTGQDWYQQRLNQIASMMSMQNSDPNYLLGSLIGDTLRKPFQNWLDNKVLPTITGSGNNDNNKQALSLKEELLNTPITGYDINTAAQANNQNMDLSRLGQQQEQPQTQAQINENNNNLTNQAVMQEAQKDNGSLSGNNIMSDLGQNVVNNAISNVFGIPSFYQASSLKTGGEANSYNGQSIEQMLYQQIIDAKNKYASAQQNGDMQGMQQAQQQANGARQLADLYGIKLDVAGGENTVEEVQNRLNKVKNFDNPTYDDIKMQLLNGVLQSKQDYANAQQNAKKQQEETERINNLTPQELLNQPDITVSPNIFYQRAYQSLSDKGIPEYRARQKASDMAMQYEANYMNNLQNVMNTTGINPDGSLNSMGIALLSQATLANNPEMAQLYASQFASPKEQWGFARDIDKANLQQKFNQENINTKYNQDIDMLARKTAAQKDVNSFNTGLQLQIRNQSEQNEKIARMNAAQQLVSAGVWDQGQGLLYVLTGKMPNSGSGNSSSSDKTPAWSRPLAEGFSKAKGTLDAEDIDDFKNEVAKYLPEMDEEDSTYANSMILALEGLREDRAGNKEMAAKYFSGIPDYYKEVLLPGY